MQTSDSSRSKTSSAATAKALAALASALEELPLAAAIIDGAGTIDSCNQRLDQLLGKERWTGRKFAELTDSTEGIDQPLISRHDCGGESQLLRWNLTKLKEVDGFLAIAEDLNPLASAEKALKVEKAYFENLFEQAPVGIAIVDVEDRILDCNQAFEELFGLRRAEITGKTLANLIVPLDRHAEAQMLTESARRGQRVRIETTRRRANGDLFDVSVLGCPIHLESEQLGAFVLYLDISDLKRAERRLRWEALHDPLTDLPNRTDFQRRLSRAIERSKRSSAFSFAVLFLDIDRFKVINDSLGHEVGDRLLKSIARRLREQMGPTDTLARIGGDEFVVLLEAIPGPEHIEGVARRLAESLDRSFEIDEREIFVSGSIGIAVSEVGYESSDMVMRDADTAMFRAKNRGVRFAVFDQEMHEEVTSSLELETALRRAIDRNELVLAYQPIVDLADLGLRGFEVLLRWRPGGHPVNAETVIRMAEETGLIIDIGRWVLGTALQQLGQWRQDLPEATELSLHINLSRLHLARQSVVETVQEALLSSGLEPGRLVLEITESALLEETALAAETLDRLKALGVRIAIDDFGTGYSSLSALHQFPLDSLKIDRSFITKLSGDSSDGALVDAIIHMADALGLSVVAEGVETEDQRQQLLNLGCRLAQGWLIAPALEIEAATKFITAPGSS